MAQNAKLISLLISPYSERCKFALKVAGMLDDIEIVNYSPMVDELYLRRVLWNWNFQTRVTVPVLVFQDGKKIDDSVRISRWAADNSGGKLVNPGDEIMNKINRLCDEALEAGRFRCLTRCAASSEFDAEMLPPPARLLPNVVISSMFGMVNRYMLRKYANPDMTMDSEFERLRSALRELNEMRLKNGGKFIVGDSLSVADIIVTSTMAFFPLTTGHSRLGPVMTKLMHEPELVAEFTGFIAWRDDLYAKYRGAFKVVEGKASI